MLEAKYGLNDVSAIKRSVVGVSVTSDTINDYGPHHCRRLQFCDHIPFFWEDKALLLYATGCSLSSSCLEKVWHPADYHFYLFLM